MHRKSESSKAKNVQKELELRGRMKKSAKNDAKTAAIVSPVQRSKHNFKTNSFKKSAPGLQKYLEQVSVEKVKDKIIFKSLAC